MPKDNYHVIAYRLLTHLYACLKKGAPVDRAVLTASYFKVSEPYWKHILKTLSQDGYIAGILICPTLNGDMFNTQNIAITHKGIVFLSENSPFQKIKKAVTYIVERFLRIS